MPKRIDRRPRKTTRRQVNWFDWSIIVPLAATLVRSFTNTLVTLRQLHYLLVSNATATAAGYNNTEAAYAGLGKQTVDLRRNESFPRLADFGRRVYVPPSWSSPAAAVRWLAERYARDRREGQSFQVWVLYEKLTLEEQVKAWTAPYGLLLAAMRGYSSESLEADIFRRMKEDGRPVVVFYLGDFDGEGEDIERNFKVQAARQGIKIKHWERLAVLEEHIGIFGLTENPGKTTSSRAKAFAARHGGRNVQVEIEAITPAILERLVVNAVERFLHQTPLDDVITQEDEDRQFLAELAHALDAEEEEEEEEEEKQAAGAEQGEGDRGLPDEGA